MMNHKAFNKIQQTLPLFKDITLNIRKLLNISFKYVRVFNNGSYYRIMENLDCLQKLITFVDRGRIFAERNITNSFDAEYRFTLWPKEPKQIAMDICYQYNIWNGITLSKISESYIDIYSFSGGSDREDWHKFFTRNKPLMLEFINYFNKHKENLHILENTSNQELFRFKQGFDSIIPESEYIKNESPIINNFINLLNTSTFSLNGFKTPFKFSSRELEVLSLICHGYTAKLIAEKFNISVRTVECYVERIKNKTGLRYKTELIRFGESLFNRIL